MVPKTEIRDGELTVDMPPARDAGLVFDPDDVDGMAGAVLKLQNVDFRTNLVAAGLRNVGLFSVDRMVNSYLDLYRSAMTAGDPPR